MLGVRLEFALTDRSAGLAALIAQVTVSVPLVVEFFGQPVALVIVLFAIVPPLFVTV